MVEQKKAKNTKKFVLIKKVFKFLSILIVGFVLCYSITNLFIIKNLKKRLAVKEIDNQISNVINETREIDRKVSLIKKYINTWETEISATQKERNGVDMEKIKTLINDISKKYLISNQNISFSMPTQIPEMNGKIMNILNTEIIITFNCLTEYSVYYLLNDLRNSNYAFFIVEELDIRKIKNIDKNLIKTLIEEGNANLLSVTMKLQWYELSGK